MTPAAPPPSPQAGQESGEARKGTVWEAQRAALAEAFPDWEITCVTDLCIPLWFALYRPPLTPQQERDGFQPTMLRGSAEELQAELQRRCRVRLPTALPPASAGPAGGA